MASGVCRKIKHVFLQTLQNIHIHAENMSENFKAISSMIMEHKQGETEE